MTDPIVVTGGTGVLGRLVVERLRADGQDVRIMSRARPAPGDDAWMAADLRTGRGVDAALANARSVVHCATALNGSDEPRLAETLLRAARAADTPHLVYISIVGVDRVPLGYYRAKLATERAIARSGLPYTILRATQFHDLLRVLFANAARSPVMPIPDLTFQPIDAGDVADRLAALAVGEPMGRAPDLAGPHIRHARDLARAFLDRTGRRRLVAPVRLPGKTFRAYRDGGHLAPEQADGTVSFENYLSAHPDPFTRTYRARPDSK